MGPTAFMLLLFLNMNLHAGTDNVLKILPKDHFSNKKEKNGINLDTILKDFKNTFTFISTHYREDKFEIRMIYGNDKAIKGIHSKDHKYEDGSIFYKVVYPTAHDPEFKASLVPMESPTVRQIMIRDSQQFKKTNGWGYAVFSDSGVTLPGDPDATLATCYACHQLSVSKNNIFSTPMENIVPGADLHIKNEVDSEKDLDLKASKKLSGKLFNFKAGNLIELDPEIQILIAQKTPKVNIMGGDMLQMNFPGVMTELGSFLIEQTKKTGLPSVASRYFGKDLVFSFSYIDLTGKECSKNEKLVRFGVGTKRHNSTKDKLKMLRKCMSLN